MVFKGIFPTDNPVAARTGLLSAGGVTVERHPLSDEVWVHGPYDYENLSSSFDTILSDYCSNLADGTIYTAAGDRVSTGYPFGVVASYSCTSQGMSLDERTSRVKNMVDAVTQKAVEHELWTGEIALASGHLDARYLASHDALDLTPGGGAVAPAVGLAALEWAIGQCGTGGGGVIHMTRDVASLLVFMLENGEPDARVYSRLGTPIVPGSGYTGSGPAAVAPNAAVPVPAPAAITTAPTTQWMYATGPVAVHLGAVDYIGEKINTAKNEITVLAGRPAAVHWSGGCHFAIQVDLSK